MLYLRFDDTEKAEEILQTLKYATKDNPQIDVLIEKAKDEFEAGLDDDLNIAQALGAIFEFIKSVNLFLGDNAVSENDSKKIIKLMKNFDTVLDVIEENKEVDDEFVEYIEGKIQQRLKAKQNKDWALADSIRNELSEKGVILEDKPGGITTWKFK